MELRIGTGRVTALDKTPVDLCHVASGVVCASDRFASGAPVGGSVRLERSHNDPGTLGHGYPGRWHERQEPEGSFRQL